MLEADYVIDVAHNGYMIRTFEETLVFTTKEGLILWLNEKLTNFELGKQKAKGKKNNEE